MKLNEVIKYLRSFGICDNCVRHTLELDNGWRALQQLLKIRWRQIQEDEAEPMISILRERYEKLMSLRLKSVTKAEPKKEDSADQALRMQEERRQRKQIEKLQEMAVDKMIDRFMQVEIESAEDEDDEELPN